MTKTQQTFYFHLINPALCDRCGGPLFWRPKRRIRKKAVCGECLRKREAKARPR